MLPGCGVGREACNDYRRRPHRKAAPNAVLCLGWDLAYIRFGMGMLVLTAFLA